MYTNERYLTRGKFSNARFEKCCLAEYSETFPVAGGDFPFGAFTAMRFGRSYSPRRPQGLGSASKCPEITCAKFPSHPGYWARKGMENHSFLDADVFTPLFHEPLVLFDRTAPGGSKNGTDCLQFSFERSDYPFAFIP